MHETYTVCPTAKTQGQAVAEFISRWMRGENTVGICWRAFGADQYRRFEELTQQQQAKIKRRWPY